MRGIDMVDARVRKNIDRTAKRTIRIEGIQDVLRVHVHVHDCGRGGRSAGLGSSQGNDGSDCTEDCQGEGSAGREFTSKLSGADWGADQWIHKVSKNENWILAGLGSASRGMEDSTQ